MALVAFREQRGDMIIDHGALPIIFLYRHSFELYLKAIVYRAAVLTIAEQDLQRAMPRLWREHSLIRLVKMGEPILRARTLRLTTTGDLHENVLSLARRLDEIDAGSYAFRYPFTSQGERALPRNVFVNIHGFCEAMESVLDDVAQLCRMLRDEQLRTSEQMKLALHPLLSTTE